MHHSLVSSEIVQIIHVVQHPADDHKGDRGAAEQPVSIDRWLLDRERYRDVEWCPLGPVMPFLPFTHC